MLCMRSIWIWNINLQNSLSECYIVHDITPETKGAAKLYWLWDIRFWKFITRTGESYIVFRYVHEISNGVKPRNPPPQLLKHHNNSEHTSLYLPFDLHIYIICFYHRFNISLLETTVASHIIYILLWICILLMWDVSSFTQNKLTPWLQFILLLTDPWMILFKQYFVSLKRLMLSCWNVTLQLWLVVNLFQCLFFYDHQWHLQSGVFTAATHLE